MNEFTIIGETNFLRFTFQEVYGFPETTSWMGGYDTLVLLEIKSGNFYVRSYLYTSTGELYEFYKDLKACNENLSGIAIYKTYERNLNFSITYDDLGHVKIKGNFSDQFEDHNELAFEFTSDQTYMISTLAELKKIADKYGDMKGTIK